MASSLGRRRKYYTLRDESYIERLQSESRALDEAALDLAFQSLPSEIQLSVRARYRHLKKLKSDTSEECLAQFAVFTKKRKELLASNMYTYYYGSFMGDAATVTVSYNPDDVL